MSLSKIFVNNRDTGFEGIPLKETGQSTTMPMSQRATTNELNRINYYIGRLSNPGYLYHGTGVVTENNNFRTSDFIPCEEGDVICYFGSSTNNAVVDAISYFDASFAYIDGVGLYEHSSALYKVTIPSGVSYIRICSRVADNEFKYFYFENINSKKLEKIILTNNDLIQNIVNTPEYFPSIFDELISPNLLDQSMLISGKYIRYDTGNLDSNPAFSATDWIPCSPETTYYISPNHIQTAFYNENKQYISGTNASGHTFTTPANAAYFRTSIRTSELTSTSVINEGTQPIPYVPAGKQYRLKNSYTPEEVLIKISAATRSIPVSVLVAATDAPQSIKDRADYICPSSGSCKNTLDSALASLPSVGGVLYLSPGTYTLDAEGVPVVTVSNTTIIGCGLSTKFVRPNSDNMMQLASGVENVTIIGVNFGSGYFIVGRSNTKLLGCVYQNKFISDDDKLTFNDVGLVSNIVNTPNYFPDIFNRSENLLDQNTLVPNCYVNYSTGNLDSRPDGAFSATDWILCSPETTYYMSVNNVQTAFYNANKVYISGTNDYVHIFTTPANAAYFRASIRVSELTSTSVINEGTQPIPYENPFYLKPNLLPQNAINSMIKDFSIDENGRRVNKSQSLSSNASLTLPLTFIRKNTIISGSIQFTGTFTGLEIGRARNRIYGFWLEITSQSVLVKWNAFGTETLITTLSHGLTIKDFLQVSIFSGNLKGKIVMTTNCGYYESEDVNWYGGGEPYLKNINSFSVMAELAFFAEDLNKKVWAYGDSYFNYWQNDKWPYHILSYGFENWLESNLSGGSSTTLLPSAINDLNCGKPGYLVWALGMNDASDADQNTPNPSWLSSVETLISKCSLKGITLVLCTIPTVPDRYHEGKNKYVRESGYRYIDFAKAVGAQANGTWCDGALGGDGVHPTELGAKLLANRVLLDLPEICDKM